MIYRQNTHERRREDDEYLFLLFFFGFVRYDHQSIMTTSDVNRSVDSSSMRYNRYFFFDDDTL